MGFGPPLSDSVMFDATDTVEDHFEQTMTELSIQYIKTRALFEALDEAQEMLRQEPTSDRVIG